jgi:hypothetical protein
MVDRNPASQLDLSLFDDLDSAPRARSRRRRQPNLPWLPTRV